MPVVSSETDTYGYTEENRHMVQSFLSGKRPEENFSDGVNVTELLTLKSSAKLQGDISTNKLAIEPGAVFSGTCS